MKSSHLYATAAVLFVTIVSWNVFADPTRTESSESSISLEKTASVLRMEAEQKRIANRVGMSAPMEIDTDDGIDPVMEAMEKGLIVEATLEEVEAALAKAAATPDTADDIEAHRLKHNGSYRYFVPEEYGQATK
jgi:hypothetical protein